MANADTLHRHAVRVLPGVIKTSGVLLEENGQRELAAMLFALRRKSKGAVLFRLSPGTIEAMAHSPLEYLVEATRSRQALPGDEPFEYRQWRAVRIPRRWLTLIPHKYQDAIVASARAYFTTTTDGRAVVVVVPDACFATYIWRD